MPAAPLSFHSLYRHGFARTAVAVPRVRVADPHYNAARTLEMAKRAAANGAALTLFPELGITAYSCEDLFGQDALLKAARAALADLVEQTRELNTILLVGAPLRVGNRLFNCGLALYKGAILGATPKSYLPNYREFYEARQFAPASAATQTQIELCGQSVPFGTRLVFAATNRPDFSFSIEICEDVWTPLPPSTFAALGGATVLCNLSASNITIGKADYRKNLCSSQSAKCLAAYLYSAAGPGESTTDLAWDGHALIYENGDLLAESPRFSRDEEVIFGDIDLERLSNERARLTSYTDTIERWKDELADVRTIPFNWEIPAEPVALERVIERFPFVPNDANLRDERCYEAYNIQVHGLLKRLEFIKGEQIVIGVSGGLDSTHALIVAAKTMDRLGLPRTNILGYTMPGYATSAGTKSNAWALMESLGITAREIDIKPSSLQMLKDIEHPFGAGEPQYDVTFENVQAGERTSHLFRLANFPRRDCAGNRRFVGTRVGLVHLRRGRSHEPLQRQRLRAQDFDSAFDPLHHRIGRVRRAHRRDFAGDSGHRNLAGIGARWNRWRRNSEHAAENRALRIAGFPSVLHHALWLCALQNCVSGLQRVEQRASGRVAAGLWRRGAQSIHAGRNQALASGVLLSVFPNLAVQTFGGAQFAQSRERRQPESARRLARAE